MERKKVLNCIIIVGSHQNLVEMKNWVSCHSTCFKDHNNIRNILSHAMSNDISSD